MPTDDDKTRLRTKARAVRRVAFEVAGPTTGKSIARHGTELLGSVDGRTVAGYMAHASEVDIGPLMAELAGRGARMALPVVTAPDAALTFRAWSPGDVLVEGAYGIAEPDVSAPEVTPDIVLVPLLAFDAGGYRLGQGGGFYDRTLDKLRRDGDVTAIGVAFAAQKIDEIPRAGHDQRLDAVITEDGNIKT